MSATPSVQRRGRPAAASRSDVVRAAMRRYLRGERIDVQAIATELGLGRATIYRWFGSRDGLIGAVLARAAEAAVRILTRGDGYFQPRLIALVTNLIEDEVRAGDYEPPVDPATLAYAICASARRSSTTRPRPGCAATSTAFARSRGWCSGSAPSRRAGRRGRGALEPPPHPRGSIHSDSPAASRASRRSV